MKKCLLILFLLVPFFIYGQSAITILDFEVNSNNKDHKYLGKGFSQFVSVELSKYDELSIVEREKRNEIIEEIKVGLSGLTNEDDLIQLGNLLQAKYLVTGEIFDMSSQLVFTCRIIDIETGVVMKQISTEGDVGQYKIIVDNIVSGIAVTFDIEKQAESIATSSTDAEVLETFSNALDAYDKGDDERARTEIQKAKVLDGKNSAVIQLENKLIVISPKFQFEDPMWQSSYNPAASVMLDSNLFYFRSDIFQELFVGDFEPNPNVILMGDATNPTYLYNLFPFLVKSRIGYNFKVSDKIGINTEIGYIVPNESVTIYDIDNNDRSIPIIINGEEVATGSSLVMEEQYIQVTAGTAYKLTDNFSVGLNGSIILPINNYNPNGYTGISGDEILFGLLNEEGNTVEDWNNDLDENDNENSYVLPDKIGFLINPGVLLLLFSQSLLVDFNVAIPINHVRYYYDYDQDAFINGTWPIYLSASVNGTLIDNKLFLGFKSNFDIYRDIEAKGFFLKETPVLEFWPTTFISMRGGYIFSFYSIDERSSYGHGILAGITFINNKFDLDVTYNNRTTPISIVEGVLVSTGSVLISVTYHP